MAEKGYNKCNLDHCVYLKRLYDDKCIILCLYVDDMLVVGSNMDHMKDLGAVKQILGMKIIRDRKNGKKFISN
jgi:hypothetical protein